MKTVVFANAKIYDYNFYHKYIDEDTLIICCDGAVRHLEKLGILPDYLVGDFDSISQERLSYYTEMGVNVKRFPARKDITDLKIGIDLACDLEADDITIFGALGSRLDHTLANVQVLYTLLLKGINAKIVNENNIILLTDREIKFQGCKGDLVSLIPLSQKVTGVTTYGLDYPLNDATLSWDGIVSGVSNVMIGNETRVTVDTGYLLAMKTID